MDPPEPSPPRVAPLAPLALAVVAGIVTDRYAEPLGTSGWVGLALGLSVAGVVAAGRRWAGALALLGTWGALAGGWHHYRWSDLEPDDLARVITEAPRPAWVRGVIREALGFRPGDAGVTRLVLDISGVHHDGEWRPASGRALVAVAGDRSDLRAGTAVEAAGALALAAGPLNPGEVDHRAALRAGGVRLRLAVDGPSGVWDGGADRPSWRDPWRLAVRWRDAARSWSRARLAAGLDPKAAPLASALLLGRREGVDPDVNDAFARTGTTHLLAISGLHMEVLAVSLGCAFRLLGLGRRASFRAVAGATVAYALLVGLMPSVVRSAVMTVTCCAAGWCDRPSRLANRLALAAMVTLGLNPSDLFDAGCQLSFLAVAAIVWVAEPVAVWFRRARDADPLDVLERHFQPTWRGWVRRAGSWAVTSLVISSTVWLAALPLVALRFHLVSPVGVVLNVPLVPITSAALLASGVSLGLSTVWEPLGRPAAWVNGGLLAWTESLVRWGAAQRWGHAFVAGPSWGWVLGFYLTLGLATAALIGRWPGRKGAALLAAGWAAVGLVSALIPGWSARPEGAPPEADVLAVGHGLAVIIDTGGGRAVLYDCGRMRDPSVGRRVIAPALWARGIRRLDRVILSHADADHYDGLPDLLDRFAVGAVLVPEGFASGGSNPDAGRLLDLVRSRGVAVEAVVAGDSWSAGATRFAVLHPPRGWSPSAPDNARSVVLDVAWNGRHALLTGDLDGEGLSAFVTPPGHPVDVFLAPHHGGRTANPAWLYDRVKPALVVVSQRPPVAGSRDPLAGLSVPVLRTWQRGAIRLRWSGSGGRACGFLDGENSSADDADGRR